MRPGQPVDRDDRAAVGEPSDEASADEP